MLSWLQLWPLTFSLQRRYRRVYCPTSMKHKYVNAREGKAILHRKIRNWCMKPFFVLLSRVSGCTTTTSSPVKPLGAGLYWKPVALTKNPTVVDYGEVVAAVSYLTWILHRVRQLTLRWCLHRNRHTSSTAASGNIIQKTQSFNCKPLWSTNKIAVYGCEGKAAVITLTVIYCQCNQYRKRIWFEVQPLITDLVVLPIKVWKWALADGMNIRNWIVVLSVLRLQSTVASVQ